MKPYLFSTILLFTGISVSCNSTNDSSQSVNVTDNSSSDAFSVVTAMSALRSGSAECVNGGVSIDTGIDSNGSGFLDANEVTNTYVICNNSTGVEGAVGIIGVSSLVIIEDENSGANCSQGGKKIQNGLDLNGNGTLEESVDENVNEVISTEYICNSGNLIDFSIMCDFQIDFVRDEVTTPIFFSYDLSMYQFKDLHVYAEIIAPSIAISKNAVYTPIAYFNEAYSTAAISLNLDVIAPANFGYWTISSSELVATIEYNDIDTDLTPILETWDFDLVSSDADVDDNCVIIDYQ